MSADKAVELFRSKRGNSCIGKGQVKFLRQFEQSLF
jgi:hypothetical protein